MKKSKLRKETYKMQNLRRKGAPVCVKSFVKRDEQIQNWMISKQDLTQLSFQLVKKELQKSEKELKKSLGPGVAVHNFNSNNQKVEKGGSLSLRPAWFSE